MIPHNALIPELVQDGPMRVNAYTISSFFFVTGSAIGYVSPLIVNGFKSAGMATLGAWRMTFGIFTAIGIVLLIIPAFTIKEKDYVHSVIPNVTLKDSLKHAFSNKHFRIVTLGQLLENTGMAFFQACIMYYVTSLMGLAETYSVLILAISIAGSLALYPLVNKFAKRKGKKLPVILGCIVFSIAEIVICFSDKIPGNKLVLACVFALFVSFPFAVLNVLPGAMMGDIIQYDTEVTGINQEGIFGAAKSFIVIYGQFTRDNDSALACCNRCGGRRKCRRARLKAYGGCRQPVLHHCDFCAPALQRKRDPATIEKASDKKENNCD